ncbi:DUF11 domain-containing protein [Methyloterricola oryzae]|uniref:DUF11 domain-containing protein n=1 Tax=Methyloterricola oryzae TaxID=1495050 RepID=UPI000A829938|nr:DUF11 domain-containing protein [Methyloterricola oryzae]
MRSFSYGIWVLLAAAYLMVSEAQAARAFLGQYPAPDARSVAVKGSLAYVCGGGGISVLDIANPAAPTLVSTVGAGTAYADCAINGSLLLATTSQANGNSPFQLHVFSLSGDGRNPLSLGISPLVQYSLQAQLIATPTHAFASQFQLCFDLPVRTIFQQGGDLLSIPLNLNNPANPTRASPALGDVLFNQQGDLLSGTLRGDCRLNGGNSHVWRMALASADTLLLASTSVTGTQTEIGSGLVRVVDISNPAQLQEVRSLAIPGTRHAIGVAVDGNRALVIGSQGGWFNPFAEGERLLQGGLVATVLDLSDPRNPSILASQVLPYPSRTFWSNMLSLGGGRYAFSSLGGIGDKPQLLVIDASNPASLVLDKTSIDKDLAGMNSMAVSGANLLLANANGLFVYDHTRAVAVGADLAVSVSDAPDPVSPGGSLTYTALVSNYGPGSASNVQFSLTLPAGVTFVSASAGCTPSVGRVDCTIGNLASGQNVGASIVTVAPPTFGGINASAQVSASEADPNPSNNSAAPATTIAGTAGAPGNLPTVDLSIKFNGPRKVKLNSTRTFSLTIKNRSKVSSPQTVVSGRFPDNVRFSRLPRFCSLGDDQLVTCQLGTLKKKASKTFKLKAKATRLGAPAVDTTATIFSTLVNDPNTSNNSTRIDVTVK